MRRSRETSTSAEPFDVAGGATELAGVGLDELGHVGPWGIVIALIAAIVAPLLWLRRRRPHT